MNPTEIETLRKEREHLYRLRRAIKSVRCEFPLEDPPGSPHWKTAEKTLSIVREAIDALNAALDASGGAS